MSPRNSAGQAAKPPRRKELGTIPLRLPAAGKRSKVYFNPISIVFPIYFTQRSGVYFYFISIVFPVRYFVLRLPAARQVPGTLYNPRHQVRITN
jgi:hypothetical protein